MRRFGGFVSSTNKTDRHDMTDILLKVALSIISLTPSTIMTVREGLHFTHMCKSLARPHDFNKRGGLGSHK
jgi:hypothetical protein